MSNKSPVFPIPPQPQHFSDYGFDPQIDYFQVLEVARKHKRESLNSIDALHFKLQKPISKEDSQSQKRTAKKKRWWRNSLLFWRWKWTHTDKVDRDNDDAYMRRNRAYKGAVSGPVYITESRSGSVTPCRTISRPKSGPLAGTLTPTRKEEVVIPIPYLSLREINQDQQQHQISTSAMPIYLVT